MKDIPFTSEVPKVPGAYWVKTPEEHELLVKVRFSGERLIALIDNEKGMELEEFFDCLWSPPLIPISTLKTAVKEAWEEGFCSCCSRFKEEGDKLWAESNARKIVEGEE